jgi:hypothetical protein
MNVIKIPFLIVISAALVWFGGAGLAFATCSAAPMPTCDCNHSHGNAGCCCGHHSSSKTAPASAINHSPVQSCACNFTRSDSSAINITVNRGVDPAIIPESFAIASGVATVAPDQIFRASPSHNTPITPLRI